MGKIIRTPTRAEGGITPEEKFKMDAIAKKWIANAFRTEPADRAKLTDAIERLYAVAGLKKPRVVVVSSPFVMACAYGLSAGWWWLKNNKNTDAATYAATYNATGAATDAATGAATDAATDAATRSNWLVGLAKKFGGKHHQILLESVKRWTNAYQGGAYWTWVSYYEAMRDVLGLTGLDCWEKYQAYEDAAKEGCFRVMHGEFCIVSDFPRQLHVLPDGKPHNADGPSHLWSDGFGIYHLWGIRFTPEEWKKWRYADGKEVLKLPNADQRAAVIRAQGAEKILKDCGGKVVATDEYGELLELEGVIDGNGRPYRFLKAFDPAHGQHVYLRCSPDCKTPEEAETRSYRLQNDNLIYKPAFRT